MQWKFNNPIKMPKWNINVGPVSKNTKIVFIVLAALFLIAQTAILRVGRFNNVRYCNYEGFTGANFGVKFASCINDLPSTGGIAVVAGMEGVQSVTSDVFTGVTKKVHIVFGGQTITPTVDLTFPVNISLEFTAGSMINCNSRTITINGPIEAGPHQIFTNCGTSGVILGTYNTNTQTQHGRVLEVYPQWWGASGEGKQCFDAAITSADATLTSATCNFTASDVGKPIVVEGAGTSSDVLITTVASLNSSTSVELTATAGTTASGSMVVIAVDDTTPIQAAINANLRVRFLSGVYGFTALDLRQGSQLLGSTNGTTALSRMGEGSGGSAIGMTTGQIATKLTLTDLWVYGNQVGTALDCIDFAEQGNAFAYSFGSWMNNIHTNSCSGIHYDINSNIGRVGQLWALNLPGSGTKAALVNTDAKGFRVVNTDFGAELLSAEGHFAAGEMQLTAQGSKYHSLQIESLGTFGSIDAVTFDGPHQVVTGGIYAQFHGAGPATRRDMVRITAAGVKINNFNMPDAVTVTCTNIINITYANPDKAYGACTDTNRTVLLAGSMTSASAYGNNGSFFEFNTPINFGGGTTTAASTLLLPDNANFFTVTGNNNINYVSTLLHGTGSIIYIRVTGTPALLHNGGAPPADTLPMYLRGLIDSLNVSTTTYIFGNNGTHWEELARSVNNGATATVQVRNPADTGTCNIVFRAGIFDSTTC